MADDNNESRDTVNTSQDTVVDHDNSPTEDVDYTDKDEEALLKIQMVAKKMAIRRSVIEAKLNWRQRERWLKASNHI